MADVRFTNGSENRIANGVHERIGIRVSVQSFAMRNFDAAQRQFASRDKDVNVITDADMDHVFG
jgi:hypothetical protein